MFYLLLVSDAQPVDLWLQPLALPQQDLHNSERERVFSQSLNCGCNLAGEDSCRDKSDTLFSLFTEPRNMPLIMLITGFSYSLYIYLQ